MQFNNIIKALVLLINIYYVSCDMKKSWKSVEILNSDHSHSEAIQFRPKLKSIQQGGVINNNKNNDNLRSTHINKEVSKGDLKEVKADEVPEAVTEAQQKLIAEEQEQVKKIQNEIEQYFDKEFERDDVEAEADSDDPESNKVEEDGESSSSDGSKNYNIGPGVDVSLNVPSETVNVTVNARLLKDVIEARRSGKRYELITKIIPLLIVPFLIQSAIVPFMVSTIKLFILKSFFIGKIAVILLLLGAFKNLNNKSQMKSLEDTPVYGHPSERRYEGILAGLAGYKADGRPATWIQ